MSTMLLSLPEVYTSYKSWVSKNPQVASEYETIAKWISYFLAGKINNSHVISELVYCLSNLLVLFNDRIINNVRQLELPTSGDRLKLWLTVIEYCEVLFELSSQKIWGVTVKWIIIVSVQIFKCISRLLLIHKYKEPIIQSPPIPSLDRNKLIKFSNNNDGSVVDMGQSQMDSVSFTLKSSGRVVRKIDASPPLCLRTWKPLQKQEIFDNKQTLEQALAGRQLIAETVYVVKPIAHLATLACFGNDSWKPWILSLILDVTSLRLYNSCKKHDLNSLTSKQRLQMSKRTVFLIMYLLRSPFYERHSKDKIEAFLMALGQNIPLVRLVTGPLVQYLPFWQSKYFYMWST